MNLEKKLNVYLANQTLMYTKLHNLHWYVVGPSFFTLHELFEDLYDKTTDIIDEVAERMLALDLKPVGSLKAVLELATLTELSDQDITGKDAVTTLVKDVEKIIADTVELIDLTEDQNDGVTAGMLTNYLEKYQKTMWMLKAYLR